MIAPLEGSYPVLGLDSKTGFASVDFLRTAKTMIFSYFFFHLGHRWMVPTIDAQVAKLG